MSVLDNSPEAQARAACKAPYEVGDRVKPSFRLQGNLLPMTIPLPDDFEGGSVRELLQRDIAMDNRVVRCSRCDPTTPELAWHNQRHCSGFEALPKILILRFIRDVGFGAAGIRRKGCPISCPAILPADDVVTPPLRNLASAARQYKLVAAMHQFQALNTVGHYTADVIHLVPVEDALREQWYKCDDDRVTQIAQAQTQESTT